MKSPLLALILIVNLLACPLRCFSCEASVTMGDKPSLTACVCCAHGDSEPASELPAPGGGDCSCQNCFCDGAMVAASFELPDDRRLIRWWQPTHSANCAITGSGDFFGRAAVDPGGQNLFGRARCVVHQSWLI